MLNDLYLRPSCYCCSFKGLDRITDITIGDAWGVSTYAPEMNDNKGLSVILIHSDTGESLLTLIANRICCHHCLKFAFLGHFAPFAKFAK